MIKFSHSIFALPFALTSLVLAAGPGLGLGTVVWILVAMVGARSAAMGFNRLADQWIDARNPVPQAASCRVACSLAPRSGRSSFSRLRRSCSRPGC